MKDKKPLVLETPFEVKELPAYEVPQVTSYTDKEILEDLGPALAGSASDRA